MKIALIVTGLLRDFDKALGTWRDQTRWFSNDVDVFISTWDSVGYYTGKGYLPERSDGFIQTEDTDKGFAPGPMIESDKLMFHFNPVVLDIQHFDRYEPIFEEHRKKFVNAYTRPKNTIAQFYKIARGIKLCQEYVELTKTEYDLVIRIRPDYFIQQPFNQLLNINTFYTNPGSNKRGLGTGDGIQISSYENMLRFGRIYDVLPQLYTDIGYSCPHVFVQKMVVDYMKINLNHLNIVSTIAHSPFGPYQEPDGTGEYRPK